MELNDYQSKAHETATTVDREVYTLGLIGEVGSVASAIKKYKRDHPSEAQVRRDIQEELGDVLWYLSELATQFKISLEDLASENLKKTAYLFKGRNSNFDDGFPEEERFPRRISIRFDDDSTRLLLFADGTQVGNALTDNAYEDDGYRYHDAFHVAYMTILGWSPVMRALLNRKRKKDLIVDEVEDGARSRALEEGISILVFSQSPPPNVGPSPFADTSQIPFWLLESIKKMTTHLEVECRSVTEWRAAISEGFRLFDMLRDHRGGTIVCDLDKKTLDFVAP